MTLSWTREDRVRRRDGKEAVLYVTSAILTGEKCSVGYPKDGLFMKRSVQYDVEASSFYDLLWEIFFIPVQREGMGQIWRLREILGVGGYVVG